MSLDRRECLRLGLGLGAASVLACGNSLPGFLAHSAPGVEGSSKPDRILVVIELDGGNDGLNTIVPYIDDAYHRNRPKLGIDRKSVIRIDDHVGFHPQLGGLAALLEEDQLAVIQSVGYPNPIRSHFNSMAIWHTGQLGASLSTQGWLSRYLDAEFPAGQLDTPAMHVDSGKLTQALFGGRLLVPSVEDLQRINRRVGVPKNASRKEQINRLDTVLAEQRGDTGSQLQFIQQSSLVSFASSKRLRDLLNATPQSHSIRYPETGLGKHLHTIAHLTKAGLSTQIYYTRLGGFDTHVDQRFAHADLLSTLGDSVRAFVDDLESGNLADRVLVMVFSEFGRRLKENAADGTDHGTAGPVLLIGPAVKSGLHGPYPDLVNVVDEDPKYAIDFRRIYATVLERWLETDSNTVLGNKFPALDVI